MHLKSVYAIFGLGNPGEQYHHTRHNCGFRFIDSLANQYQTQLKFTPRLQASLARTTIADTRVWLVKPLTFVNNSGAPFQLVTSYYGIPLENTIVVHDDIDLPVGVVRLKSKGGHGGHNGLRDIIAKSNNNHFIRVRIGVGRPKSRKTTVSHVLSKASLAEQSLIDEAAAEAQDWIPKMIAGNFELALTHLHSRKSAVKNKPTGSAAE